MALILGNDPGRELTRLESDKREALKARPEVYRKSQYLDTHAHLGFVSPIVRFAVPQFNACNFHCDHCYYEVQMERDIKRRTGHKDPRRLLTLEDIAKLSEEMHQINIFRCVFTGGEATLSSALFDVLKAVDPQKHLVYLDTNGWLTGDERAGRDYIQRLAAAGLYKVQLSLDSSKREEHDLWRKKDGSFDRVIRTIRFVKEAGLQLLLSTCLTRGRAFTEEFAELVALTEREGTQLYVTLLKPTGKGHEIDDQVCTKADVDKVREFERRARPLTTHMTRRDILPQTNVHTAALGGYRCGGCITMKGILTVEKQGGVMFCPYTHLDCGNVLEEPLSAIIDRGMMHPLVGPYRPECIIGENPTFIRFHAQMVEEWTAAGNLLPVPWSYWSPKWGQDRVTVM